MIDETHKVALLLRVDEEGVDELHDVKLPVVGPEPSLLRHAMLHHLLVDHLGGKGGGRQHTDNKAGDERARRGSGSV